MQSGDLRNANTHAVVRESIQYHQNSICKDLINVIKARYIALDLSKRCLVVLVHKVQ